VVAFDLPEHRLTAQAAALYACPNEELDLARQIATLMDDPERCRQLGRIGRKRIEDGLSWQHQAEALCLAYDSLI
jgi:glycosyltransferase involved in cell wall biosynthesis